MSLSKQESGVGLHVDFCPLQTAWATVPFTRISWKVLLCWAEIHICAVWTYTKYQEKKKGKHESKLSVKRFEDIQSNNFFEGSYCFFLHHFTLIFHCSSPSLSLFIYWWVKRKKKKKRKMVTDKIPTIIFAYTLVWLKLQIWLSQPRRAICPSVRQECQNLCALVSTFK